MSVAETTFVEAHAPAPAPTPNKVKPRKFLLPLLLPAVILLALLSIYPLGWLIYSSFHTVSLAPGAPQEWVGGDNWPICAIVRPSAVRRAIALAMSLFDNPTCSWFSMICAAISRTFFASLAFSAWSSWLKSVPERSICCPL